MEIRSELTAKVSHFLIRTLYLNHNTVFNARFEKNQIILEVVTSRPDLPVNQAIKLHFDQEDWARAGYEAGYHDGINKGIEEGFRLGQEHCCDYQDGFVAGYGKGLEEGSEVGKRRGYATGYWQGCRTAKSNKYPDMLQYVAPEEKADDEKETEDSLEDEG